METMATGSCLCGAVSYATSADFEMSGNCHCNTCKKITGGPFEAFAIIDAQSFELNSGEKNLVQYKISPKAKKNFCGVCGTPIYNQHRHTPGKVIVHIGSLDDPSIVKPTFNLHCDTMLEWVLDLAKIKAFAQGFER